MFLFHFVVVIIFILIFFLFIFFLMILIMFSIFFFFFIFFICPFITILMTFFFNIRLLTGSRLIHSDWWRLLWWLRRWYLWFLWIVTCNPTIYIPFIDHFVYIPTVLYAGFLLSFIHFIWILIIINVYISIIVLIRSHFIKSHILTNHQIIMNYIIPL